MFDVNIGNRADLFGKSSLKPLWALSILIVIMVCAMGCSTRGEEEAFPKEIVVVTDGDSYIDDGQVGDSEIYSFESSYEWVVSPTLNYDVIYYCPICEAFTGDYMDILDPATGEVLDVHYGHGAYTGWLIYDEAEDVLGFYQVSEEGGELELLSLDELASEMPFFADTLILLHAIDSTKIEVKASDWGDDYYLGDDFPGKCALAYGDNLLSGYIFDEGETYGARLFNSIIAVRQADYWGIFDRNGAAVVPFMLEQAITIDDNSAFAKLDRKYGIVQID